MRAASTPPALAGFQVAQISLGVNAVFLTLIFADATENRKVWMEREDASLPNFPKWTESYGGRKYTAEQEANEFAGRLLVPETRLRNLFDEFAGPAERLVSNFVESSELRAKFSQTVALRFGVNASVIPFRLDRNGIGPAA